MQQQREAPSVLDDMRKAFNLALFVSFILAVPVQIWGRKIGSLGSKYVSYHFALGLLWIIVFGAFAPPHEQPLFLGFAGFCTAGLILHAMLRKKGNHSQYVGDSIFGSGKHAMTMWETLGAGAVALCFAPFSIGLSALIGVSGVASGFFHSWVQDRDNARLRAMRDAQIEQGYFMDLHGKDGE